MEEVTTCSCKNQSWKIFSDRIKCTVCLREFDIEVNLLDVVKNAPPLPINDRAARRRLK